MSRFTSISTELLNSVPRDAFIVNHCLVFLIGSSDCKLLHQRSADYRISIAAEGCEDWSSLVMHYLQEWPCHTHRGSSGASLFSPDWSTQIAFAHRWRSCPASLPCTHSTSLTRRPSLYFQTSHFAQLSSTS